ncbi:glycosyltransferase [bacterium]|nr:glycosyltransferase [bacterium]
MARILVFTATYNEADNIESLVDEINRYLPGQHILIVDDSSPDGTGDILDRLADANEKIHVVHRPRKLGLGTAHKLAMKYAVQNGFDILVTMDADFSHHPKYLPTLIEKIKDHDFVIGSRYMKGGGCGYGFVRNFISRTANILARSLLGLKLKETTTSYRGFRVSELKKLNIDSIHAEGYAFFVESIFVVSLLTDKLAEFPIYFADRRAGSSKISKVEILKGITNLLRLFYLRLFSRAYRDSLKKDSKISESICANCQSIYNTEVYPASVKQIQSNDVYQCTNFEHKSHGRIVQCLQCGLMYTESRLSDVQLKEFYADVEDPLYARNIDARYQTFRYNLNQIRGLLPVKGRLLDVGAYCGAFLKIAQESGFEAMGIEPSKWASRFAREELNQNVMQGALKDIPAHINGFDVISLWDVLEHVHDPREELRLISSKLSKGGILVFSTLDVDNWFPRLLGERWPWFMDMHLFYFNQEVLNHMLSQTGFELIHIQSYSHFITVDYFLSKLESLGVWGIKYIKKINRVIPLGKMNVKFRFGDIKMFVARKI